MNGKMVWPDWATSGVRILPEECEDEPHSAAPDPEVRQALLDAVARRLISLGPKGRPTARVVNVLAGGDGHLIIVITVAGHALGLFTATSVGQPVNPGLVAAAVEAHAKELSLRSSQVGLRMSRWKRITESAVFAQAGIRCTNVSLAPRGLGSSPRAPYAMHVQLAVLGSLLDTVPSGCTAVSANYLKRFMRSSLEDQIRRRARLTRLEAFGAVLESDGISVRAIAGRGLDLSDVVYRVLGGEIVELPTDEAGMHFRAAAVDGFLAVEWGYSPRVFVRRGVVEIGDVIPETLLAAATGRAVMEIVDHPFLRDGPIVGRAERSEPPQCSFLEVLQPALFIRRNEDGGFEAFAPTDGQAMKRPGHDLGADG